MGSVPDLYTTGDNDPEIEPVRYFRHYLYCDACGSFELDPWMAPAHHQRLEKTRRRLARAAVYSSVLAVVSGWHALGLFPTPAVLAATVAGAALFLFLRSFPRDRHRRWRAVVATYFGLFVVGMAGWLATDFLPPSQVCVVALVLTAGLLVARAVLGAKIENLGMRCRRCDATYAHRTPFFTDLDANPRDLTVAEVPRPLGVSPFLRGESVEYEPAPPPSRLPG